MVLNFLLSSEGFEPPITGPKPVVISISPRGRVLFRGFVVLFVHFFESRVGDVGVYLRGGNA